MSRPKRKRPNLHDLESNLGYKFKDLGLLNLAITHSSYSNENKMDIVQSNERLEFLGDAILNLIVSQYLYHKYPKHPEGELTKIRAKVVCESSLAYAAQKISLGDFLLLGKGEEATGVKRESILADAAEAIVGHFIWIVILKLQMKYFLETLSQILFMLLPRGTFSLIIRLSFKRSFRRMVRPRWSM